MVTEDINNHFDLLEATHLVCAVDQDYLQHFYAMFRSVIDNMEWDSVAVHLHLIYYSISENELMDIQNYFSSSKLKINIYEMNHSYLKDFFISEHISLATYYRIMIPNLLDSSIQKVIYLDSDLIICQNIRDLWTQDIGSNAVGAVIDLQGMDRKAELGIPKEYSYFNAGVLLINLSYWRKNQISEKIIDFIECNPDKLKYWDQDALNAILYDKCFILPYQWNVQTNAYQVNDYNGIKNALKKPCIIHYTTASKPWHLSNNHPLKQQYYIYLKRTPYEKFSMIKQETLQILINKSHVFIFGAGELGQGVMHFFRSYKNIIGFIDNDARKSGMVLNGKEIYSVNKIEEFNYEDIGIIVSSVHYRKISEQLISIGLVEKLHFVQQL